MGPRRRLALYAPRIVDVGSLGSRFEPACAARGVTATFCNRVFASKHEAFMANRHFALDQAPSADPSSPQD
jgi:hypothetical protein